MIKYVIVSFVVAAAIYSPVAAKSEPDFSLPTFSGAYQPQGEDEKGLWALDDESERALRDSRLVINDPQLNNYIRSVLCKTVGQDRCNSVRIYIMRLPVFNASMSPNGTMRVYSGLLLRTRNEAELSSILGHEFAHFELRHTLDDFKRERSGSDFLAWTSLLTAIANTYGTGSTTSMQDTRISVYGALRRFNREQEREADVRGFAYMASARYRPSAAAEVWRAMMNETDQTAKTRNLRSTRYDQVAYFATHPTNLERADYLRA